jgi:hypothetical protein
LHHLAELGEWSEPGKATTAVELAEVWRAVCREFRGSAPRVRRYRIGRVSAKRNVLRAGTNEEHSRRQQREATEHGAILARLVPNPT